MEANMMFQVYQHERDQDSFVVTDKEHAKETIEMLSVQDRLTLVGEYAEMGPDRVAFDETLARNSIRDHGFYRFTAKSFAPEGERPFAMP
jgi:hypothetical protein